MKEFLCFFVFFIGAQLLLFCDGSVSSISSSTPLLRRGRGGSGEKILASLQNGNNWLATKLSSFFLEPLEEDSSSQRPSDSQKPCVPKSGHTAIGMGQDFDSILAYTSAFASSQPSPFSLMTYTAIHSQQGNLTGLTEVIDYGSGKQWLTGLAKAFPSSSLQVGLYLVNELSAIKAGVYDHHIDRFIRVLNETGRPIYLRIGYEFETERNNYDPEEYKFVFRKIAKRFEALSVNNVAFVWHAAVEDSPRGGLLYDDWYPGDDVVDWCGISLFQQPYQCQSVTKCFMIFPEQFTAYCASHKKPMMIAESTPFGGILDDKALAKDPDRKNGAGYQGNTWNNWFTPVIGFIAAHKDVRMWNYINCDWDSLPMYKSEKNHAPGIYWGDSRIQIHSDVKDQWVTEVLGSKHTIISYEDVINDPALCEAVSSSGGSSTHQDPATDDFEVQVKHTFERELRKILYGVLVAIEMLIIVGFIVAVLFLFVQCLYKLCGGDRREHLFVEMTTASGRKKYEYMVIEDHQ